MVPASLLQEFDQTGNQVCVKANLHMPLQTSQYKAIWGWIAEGWISDGDGEA